MSNMELTGKFFAGPDMSLGRKYASWVTIEVAGVQQYRVKIARTSVSLAPTTYVLNTERAWILRRHLDSVGYVPARVRPKRGRK